MFAVHVLAPLALTTLLAGRLGRVINVSSGGMYTQSLPRDDWEADQMPYSPKKLYARTKREQVTITEVTADRLRDRGVVVHGMRPGWARDRPVLARPAATPDSLPRWPVAGRGRSRSRRALDTLRDGAGGGRDRAAMTRPRTAPSGC
jgi:NAD(P)-dependent dehydrogenase (short-subunit alcohol dehydrogenase family)